MANLSSQQSAQFKEAFSLLDLNKDGHIEADELDAIMAILGMDCTEREIADMISEVDTTGTGSINFQEFLTMMGRSLQDKSPDDILRAAFAVFDRDGSQTIDVQELRAVMSGLGENLTDAEYRELLSEVDASKGSVTFEEFRALMTA